MVEAGYKQTEVGEIPEDWDVLSLEEIVKQVRLGGNYPNTRLETNYPLIKMGNMGRGDIRIDTMEFISEGYPVEKQHRLKEGDVLFNTRNTLDLVGKVCVWRRELPRAYYNSNILRFEFSNDYISSSYFANYALNTHQSIGALRELATGTTSVAAIYTRDLMGLKIPIPLKEEQKAIAAALSDVDGLIGALEKQIAKKRNIKTATMQQLLTGKKRLPGFGEGKGYKQTELGLIPEDWSVSHFGDVVAPSKRRVNPKISGGGDICVELEHIDQKTGAINGSTLTSSDASIKSVFSSGDVLFGKLRSYLRKFWLASFDGVCSTEVWVFQPRSNQILPEYIYRLIQADEFIECASEAYGTHMPRADWSVVKEFSMALPVPEEQKKITNVFDALDNELEALGAKLSKTKSIKQGMMQELLTGRTRLV